MQVSAEVCSRVAELPEAWGTHTTAAPTSEQPRLSDGHGHRSSSSELAALQLPAPAVRTSIKQAALPSTPGLVFLCRCCFLVWIQLTSSFLLVGPVILSLVIFSVTVELSSYFPSMAPPHFQGEPRLLGLRQDPTSPQATHPKHSSF